MISTRHCLCFLMFLRFRFINNYLRIQKFTGFTAIIYKFRIYKQAGNFGRRILAMSGLRNYQTRFAVMRMTTSIRNFAAWVFIRRISPLAEEIVQTFSGRWATSVWLPACVSWAASKGRPSELKVFKYSGNQSIYFSIQVFFLSLFLSFSVR